jgi:hypothetical protein
MTNPTAEENRLHKQKEGLLPTALWGPYLSERQWGTVREDYSEGGDAWSYLPHDHARSRAYRWGEDGLAGISDDQSQLCFALALWNGRDPILKERLFGLTNSEGNHGEDVKELYYYLENTPSHSYMQYLYKYPHAEYPYAWLINENKRRSTFDTEFEIIDTGLFDDGKYFDVLITYAKENEKDICILITAKNLGKEAASLTLMPTLWFRNQWHPALIEKKPDIALEVKTENKLNLSSIRASHAALGDYFLYFENPEQTLFTENETNTEKLFNVPNKHPFVKDAFHEAVIQNDYSLFKDKKQGTKCSLVYKELVQPGETIRLKLKLSQDSSMPDPLGLTFDKVIKDRKEEAATFYESVLPEGIKPELANIATQAYSGLLWNKQFYYYDVLEWLQGDKGAPTPASQRLTGRNSKWKHLNNRDVISMPDKWEYPWYAAWDLAFHSVVFAHIDPGFAKAQQILITREWYTHPNGQIPAYEWNFSDVNPPVQAWAAMKIYEIDKKKSGVGDINFLKRIFQKLTINFTWWANRKDADDTYIFEGGFLGLDNIGIFDRSSKLPPGCNLEEADGTAWMGMYASGMLSMAIEIAQQDSSFEDIATKYFEHYVLIAEAFNNKDLWNEDEAFYYDVLNLPEGTQLPLKVRSLVGITSLFAASVITDQQLQKLKYFKNGVEWFRKYRKDKGEYLAVVEMAEGKDGNKLITMMYRNRLEKLLIALLDENEFLSPYGIRSVSKIHSKGYFLTIFGHPLTLYYEPGESSTHLFGGNSNWRGPIWFPMNYLIIESLQSYYAYFGDTLKVAFPTGSQRSLNLKEVATELSNRLQSIFQANESGIRPWHGRYGGFYSKPENKDLQLFHEYFHGETGMGIGASHQTGWTALVAALIQNQ